MAALNFTPISLYYSTTAAATPSAGNLVAGELALNTLDEKLYFKNSAGTVKLLASNVTPVANGGTSLTTLTANNVILGNGTSAPLFVAPSTAGNVLTSNGSTWTSTAPAASGVTTFSAGTTGFTPSSATSGAVTLAGTLATTNGGTGLTSFTANQVFYASSTSAFAQSSNLTFNGTILTAAGFSGPLNGTVGATTASTGAFTTVSTSGLLSANANLKVVNGANDFGTIQLGTSASYVVTGGATYSGFRFEVPTGTQYDFQVNATSRVVINGAGLTVTGTISDSNGNLRAIPQSGSAKTSSYTLATTDIGEYILLGASGAIVIPDATFATGDVVSIFNNTASTATITCSITTAYIAGTFTDKATMTLAAAGVATILFITGTTCVVSGNVT